jgi:hypothetical protein
MLARCSLVLRLLTLGTLVAPLLVYSVPAWADDDEDDDDGGGEGGDGEEEEENAVDPNQPAVTAGGLYTVQTYPQSEVERPLTLTQKVFEGRVGMGFSLIEGATFKTWITDIKLRYGVADTLEAFATAAIMVLSPEGSPTAHTIGVGAEAAIVYDVVDFRGTIEINITEPKTFFDLVVGFPVKYRLKPNIAIIALDRFFVIHTDGDRKPDLAVGLGIIFQAVPQLALYARGDIILVGFDTGNAMTIPAVAGLQFSPSGKLDAGLEFKLGNLKPPLEGASPFDDRTLVLFVRARM